MARRPWQRAPLLLPAFEMQPVHRAVHDGRSEDAHARHNNQRAEQRVERRKHFQVIARTSLRVKGARSAQEHARLEERIHQVEVRDKDVAGRPDGPRDHDDSCDEQDLPHYPPGEDMTRRQRFGEVFPRHKVLAMSLRPTSPDANPAVLSKLSSAIFVGKNEQTS